MLPNNAEDRWVEIRQFKRSTEAEQHALVLIAMSINCLLIRQPWGIGLLVGRDDAERAEYQLDAYRRENEPRPVTLPKFGLGQVLDGALIFAAILVLVQAAAEGSWLGMDWFAAGAANAGLISGGEWWRAVTALFLHADLGHLMSNIVFGAFFGVFVSQMLGAGLAWLSILAAGTAGNLLSAWLQSGSHTAIGASTAVFGALGLLAALTWLRQRFSRDGLRRYAPLAAGLMLLSFLGMGGERTDIGGHAAGFGAGVAIAFLLHFAAGRIPDHFVAQLRYGLAAVLAVITAWTLALA